MKGRVGQFSLIETAIVHKGSSGEKGLTDWQKCHTRFWPSQFFVELGQRTERRWEGALWADWWGEKCPWIAAANIVIKAKCCQTADNSGRLSRLSPFTLSHFSLSSSDPSGNTSCGAENSHHTRKSSALLWCVDLLSGTFFLPRAASTLFQFFGWNGPPKLSLKEFLIFS